MHGAEQGQAVGGLHRHTFFLVLPDPIPVHHGDGFTRAVGPVEPDLMTGPIFVAPNLPEMPCEGGENVVSLQFLQIPLPPQAEIEPMVLTRATDIYSWATGTTPNTQEDLAELATDGHYATVVAGVTFQNNDRPSIDYGNKDPLTRVIDVLIDWVRGYRASHGALIPELTYERLYPLVPTAVSDLQERSSGPTLLITLDHFFAHMSTPPTETLNTNEQSQIADRTVRLTAGDPFALLAERRLEALRLLRIDGRYGESITQAAIAAEILLDGALGIALWECVRRGDETNEGAASVLARDLRTRVKRDHGRILGGSWGITRGPVRAWSEHLAAIRNRVVHAGYRPTRDEALRALAALESLEHHVGDILARRWRSWPVAALSFLGPEGFARRHMSSRLPTDWLAANGGQIAPLVAAYAEWRDHISGLIEGARRRG